MKQCAACKDFFPLTAFPKRSPQYYGSYCRNCQNQKHKQWYDANREKAVACSMRWSQNNRDKYSAATIKYRRSLKGVAVSLYNNMRKRTVTPSAIRLNPSYFGRALEIDKESFLAFALNSDRFKQLYEDWQKSGFQLKIAPSIDRIDNKRGYSMDNIQFLTVSENSSKAIRERNNR